MRGLSIKSFFLGNEAAEEFGEVFVLAGNGYGSGGLQIIRGMYERLVTLRYLIDNPNELDTWLEYRHVFLRRLAQTAIRSISHDAIPEHVMKEIEADYARVRSNYLVPQCECGKTRVNHTWTRLDLPSMASQDEWLNGMLVEAYYLPMIHTHANPSAMSVRALKLEGGSLGFNAGASPILADHAMATAHKLLLYAAELQHRYFDMDNLELRNKCWSECKEAWAHLPSAKWPD